MLVETVKYIDFYVYHRSCKLWSPVIVVWVYEQGFDILEEVGELKEGNLQLLLSYTRIDTAVLCAGDCSVVLL